MTTSGDQRAISYVAAATYAGGTSIGLIEALITGGRSFAPMPVAAAFVICALTMAIGPRMPRNALIVLGPLGVVFIAIALVNTHGDGDAAMLYIWPVLWMAYFYGDRGTAFIVAWVGVAHAVALTFLGGPNSGFDNWFDVEVSVLVVAAVVRTLAARNERMVAGLTAEARVDPLTGLLNRRGLEERMATELARAARDGSSLAVALFDLDHFKAVNDQHGHEVGDRVLSWLGAVLEDQVRAVDVVARAGGEEFVVLLPGIDLPAAHAFAERVRVAVAGPEPSDSRRTPGIGHELELTVSGGVAAGVAPPSGQALIDAADRAMYRAKHAGRNRIMDADGARDAEPVASY